MSKYTRGPWLKIGDGEVVRPFVSKATGVTINQSIATARKSTYVAGDYIRIPKEMVDANAALIAAAPELLEACKKARSWQSCVGTNQYGDTCGVTFTCAPCQVADVLKKAIAKAEGRE